MQRIECLQYLPLSTQAIPFGYRYIVRANLSSIPGDEMFVAQAHSYMTDPGSVRIASLVRKEGVLPDYSDEQLRQDIEQEIRERGRVY